MDAFRQYYFENTVDFSFLPDAKFRHFRLRLPHGGFLKVPRKIWCGRGLAYYLCRYRPLDVYYSASCWLNPERLGPRGVGDLLDEFYINSDLVFDIDEKPFSARNIEKSRMNTVAVLDYALARGFKVKYVCFSGGKGFHVVCEDPWVRDEAKPSDREQAALECRKSLVREMVSEGLVFDEKITADTRRIIRLPGTVNSSTGYVCTIVAEDYLRDTSASEMLKCMERVNLTAPGSRFSGRDLAFHAIRTMQGGMPVGAGRHPTSYYQSNLSNTVPGLRRQILIMSFPAGMGEQELRESLSALSRKYSTGDLHVFRGDGHYFAVSLKTFDPPRIVKILRAAGSRTLGQQIKYRQSFMRVGVRKDEEGNLVGGPLRFLFTIGQDGLKSYASRPHYLFFRGNGVPLPEYPLLHGREEVQITHTFIV